MARKRRKRTSKAKISPWWGLVVLALVILLWAAVDDSLKLNPEKPIPAATKTP